jgi:hypothetical protein
VGHGVKIVGKSDRREVRKKEKTERREEEVRKREIRRGGKFGYLQFVA